MNQPPDEPPAGDSRLDVIVFDGDSITRNSALRETESYPRQVTELLSRPVLIQNLGRDGTHLRHKLAELTGSTHSIEYQASARRFIVVVLLGTNDLRTTASAIEIYLLMLDYVQRLKAFGSNVRVVVCTIMDRVDHNPEHKRQVRAFNELLRSSWSRTGSYGLAADGLADLAAEKTLANPATITDKAMFYDGVHPTARGCALIAAVVAPEVVRLLEA